MIWLTWRQFRAQALATPALLGIFWGAPLIARELETGTCRLAWNQSVTRTRWLTVKPTPWPGSASGCSAAGGLNVPDEG